MADTPLAERSCIPCRGGVPPLTVAQYAQFLRDLPEWKVVDEHHLSRNFTFKDFVSALAFVNQAGNVAEEQGHHPEITVGWGHALVEIWTHKIDGLTESDFVLAAKLDQLLSLPPHE
jgi:4a-hydroxytetrahydrobiopterin dehydratase